MSDIPQEEIVTGAIPNDFANEVAALIDSALARGFDLDVAVCIMIGVAADYARSEYGDRYLKPLCDVIRYRAGKPLPQRVS